MNGRSDQPANNPFRPIKLERVSEKIVQQLRKAITEGIFQVGDRLPSERELAEQMGVSRPSVREAFRQLEMLGMVESVHGGGTMVKSLTEQEIRSPLEAVLEQDKQRVVELTELRALMESWAARQAAINRTNAEVERLRVYLEEMERDLERERINFETDVRFHTEIAVASHNMILLHVMQSIYQLIRFSVQLYREQVFTTPSEQQIIFNHHLRIFKAILDRDPTTAEHAMNDHLVYVIQEYKRRFLGE
jgi:GntR family transcriptional regulator, transcriptional repressor for pyruvate dehydrogenase complex